MARVFISYRRSETRWAAGRLYDRLAEVIGREHLFFDVSDIEPGEDFVQRIREIVGACDVLIALIGPTWSAVQDGSGKPRLITRAISGASRSRPRCSATSASSRS